MPYNPKAIANYFLAKAEKDRRLLTPLQVIKLVYIAHGWNLGLNSQPLIDEHPEAWKFGPVIPSLYHEFKRFGSDAITKLATDVIEDDDDSDWSFDIYEVEPPDSTSDADTCELLDEVWDAYKDLNGLELSNLTHKDGTPWYRTWAERGQYRKGVIIPEKLIREHYEELAAEHA